MSGQSTVFSPFSRNARSAPSVALTAYFWHMSASWKVPANRNLRSAGEKHSFPPPCSGLCPPQHPELSGPGLHDPCTQTPMKKPLWTEDLNCQHLDYNRAHFQEVPFAENFSKMVPSQSRDTMGTLVRAFQSPCT